jgi:hypothetical protein
MSPSVSPSPTASTTRRVVQLPPFALKRIRRQNNSSDVRRSAPHGVTHWTSGAIRLRWYAIAEMACPRTPDAFTRAFKRLAHRAGMPRPCGCMTFATRWPRSLAAEVCTR